MKSSRIGEPTGRNVVPSWKVDGTIRFSVFPSTQLNFLCEVTVLKDKDIKHFVL